MTKALLVSLFLKQNELTLPFLLLLVSWVLTARSASDIVDTIKAADPTATIAHSGRLGPLVELNALLISSPAQEHQHLRSQAQPGVSEWQFSSSPSLSPLNNPK